MLIGYSSATPPWATPPTQPVSEPPSSRPPQRAAATPSGRPADRRGLFERLVEFLSPGPDSTDELMATLADAEKRELIAPESRVMLEACCAWPS